ncbi:MAG: hypothetical protein ACJATF_003128 [Flavobacteriales bacterium]|jgi:hypothetical protein
MQDKIVRNNRMKSSAFFLGICLLFLSSFFSCSNVDMAQFEARSSAFGQVNHMVVVADQKLWESAVGDTFRYYFSSAYPILPQPEPVFDLRHWTAGEITSAPIRQKKRTYLFLGDLSNEDSPASKMILKDLGEEKGARAKTEKTFNSTMGKNKWADGQTLVYLFGNSEEELTNNIKSKFSAIARRVNEADLGIVEGTAYASGNGIELSNKIKEKLGITIRVPADYILAIEDEKTMWLRKETDFLSSNIFLHKTKYQDKSQFTKEGIKAIRDSLGRKFVSTDIEDTYMRTNDQDLPMLTKVITLNNNYAVEVRGIWDIVNDYMGGPYISYLIHNPSTNDLLFVDGFVHAPGKKKRDYIQQLEFIFKSIEM